jgi:hypothetical protein
MLEELMPEGKFIYEAEVAFKGIASPAGMDRLKNNMGGSSRRSVSSYHCY